MKLLLSRIAGFIAPEAATGQYDGHEMVQGYSIDSRTVQAGELFFAVKGERLDGHDFVEQALSRGAIAAAAASVFAVLSSPTTRLVTRSDWSRR